MKRLGCVVAKNDHTIVLKLIQTEKCAGCPANCNKPLIDLFGLRKNLFVLSKDNPQYQLIDSDDVIGRAVVLEQLINISIDEKDLMFSSAWLYLLPLILCLIGIVAGHYIGLLLTVSSDLSALLGFVVGLGFSWLFLRRKISTKHLKFRPKVTIL